MLHPRDQTSPLTQVGGSPALYEVMTVNDDGTIDTRSVLSRAGRAGILIADWYTPSVGDFVIVFELNSDLQRSIAIPFQGPPGRPITVT